MFYNENHDKILKILEMRNYATVHYLAKNISVSEPTIRRALNFLEKSGKIKRTFGGAILSAEINNEVPLVLREQENITPKKEIALKAISHIRNGQLIFIDASSTAAYLVELLSQFNNLTIVTNSPKTSLKLSELKIKNYCTGGLLLENSVAYVGSHAEKYIGFFNADIMFFSCRGLSFDGYLSDQSIEETQLRQAMLARAKKKIMLCTSDKFGKKYSYNLCHYKDVTEIISDKPFRIDNET